MVDPLQVVGADLQQVGGQLLGLVADLAGGHGGGGAGGGGAAAGVGAETVGRGVGVAVLDDDVVHRQSQLVGDDLGEGRLVALPLGLDADADDGRAGGVDANLGAVEHLDAEDVEGVGGAGADDLGEGGDADAHQLAALALLLLLAQQILVADLVERLLQGGGVVAAVVLPAGRRLVGELLGLDEVLEAQLGGVDADLVGEDVDHALDHVHRFGDAEGAAVGDAARRLVGVDAVDLDVGRLQVVGAGGDAEEAGRELARVGGGVEGAVVGDGDHVERGDRAVAASRRGGP